MGYYSERPEDIQHMCGDKATYVSLRVAKEVRNKRERKMKKGSLRIYQCPHCNLYHITRLVWDPKEELKFRKKNRHR